MMAVALRVSRCGHNLTSHAVGDRAEGSIYIPVDVSFLSDLASPSLARRSASFALASHPVIFRAQP